MQEVEAEALEQFSFYVSNFKVVICCFFSILFCRKNIFNSFNIIEEYKCIKHSGIGIKRSRVGFTSENGCDRNRFCGIVIHNRLLPERQASEA